MQGLKLIKSIKSKVIIINNNLLIYAKFIYNIIFRNIFLIKY